jgi:hypothetical protein
MTDTLIFLVGMAIGLTLGFTVGIIAGLGYNAPERAARITTAGVNPITPRPPRRGEYAERAGCANGPGTSPLPPTPQPRARKHDTTVGSKEDAT